MKKFLSLLLALVLCFSLSVTAFAADETTEGTADASGAVSQTLTVPLEKLYTVTGGDTLPTETLTFKVVADGANPDSDPEVTVDSLAVKTGNTNWTMNINIPVYDTVGVYNYTITENPGASQGATYSTASIGLQVLVTYDYSGETVKLVATPSLTTESENTNLTTNGKVDTFENKYDLGSLSVSKSVAGNLASRDVYFKMVVTFNSTVAVNSDIHYEGGSGDYTVKAETVAVDGDGWTGAKTVEIWLKHGDSINFTDIPAGVTYSVEEDSAHLGTATADDTDAGYSVEYKYNDSYKVIAQNDKDTVAVENSKSITVETGITMDTIPYIVMMALVVAAAVLFLGKRRAAEY